ncbi:MAG: DUF4112 domain-containing protein [Rhodothermales bacterium]
MRNDSPTENRLERLERLARHLDDSIVIPGTRYRIGYDAIVGLIPGIGDLVGLIVSCYIVLEAARMHVPKATLGRMMANIVIETVIGAVPVLGDLFDAFYKANVRNVGLLKKRVGRPETASRADGLFLAALVLIPVLATVGLLVAVFYAVSLL